MNRLRDQYLFFADSNCPRSEHRDLGQPSSLHKAIHRSHRHQELELSTQTPGDTLNLVKLLQGFQLLKTAYVIRPIISMTPAKINSRKSLLDLDSWLITSILGSFAKALSRPPDSSVTDISFKCLGGQYGINGWI